MFLARRVLGGVLRVCPLKAGAQLGTQTHGVETPNTKASRHTRQHVVCWGVADTRELAILFLRVAEHSVSL